jgi:chromosome segregation ATPase
METESNESQLHALRAELAKLYEQREETEVRIARTKRKLAILAELNDESEDSQVPDLQLGGLTAACRTALRASRKPWLTVSEIQTALKELGFPLDQYKAPAASISTTVTRLVEYGEVVADRRNNPAATEYKWVGPNWGAPASLANMLDDEAKDKARLRAEAKRIAAIADAQKRRKK